MTAIRKALDQFVETDIDDEVIIMRRDTGKLLTLPGTAAAIWRLIDGKRDRNAVIGALADAFEMEEAAIEPDVDEFLLQLRETGLLADG